jgi:aminopeptidase N
MRRFFVVFALLFFTAANFGNIPKDADLLKSISRLKEFKIQEAKRKTIVIEKMKQAEKYGYQQKQNLDMLHYDFDLNVDPYQRLIEGSVTLTFSPTASLPSLKFRLHKKLNLVSISLDDSAVSTFSRKKEDITVDFSSPLQQGSTHKIKLEYGGTPQMTPALGGGMLIYDHEGVPSATTLSEPFEAYAWWPTIDEVSDKFTANINITTPSDMVGASNGVLTGTFQNQDGTVTYKWQEDYPISAYLVAVNVSNYSQFSDSYISRDGSKTMPLEYYVYPEHLSAAQANFVKLPEMIGLYADYVGEYPFINEKYGQVEFPWGGAMEHQTLTSMGDYFVGYDVYYNNLIYAHELAHMWYGDEVTCGTWHDIWLNEGFATYFEVLWEVHEYSQYDITAGDVFSTYYDDGSVGGYLKGSVYAKNDSKPFADSAAIYDKGGWVLHMLNHVMGEDKFWQAMKTYRERYSMSNAVTEDFKGVCEEVYGSTLSWFFDEWVYTGKRPLYSYSYSQNGNTLTLKIEQKQKHKIVNRTDKNDVYIMPVDVTLYYEDGTDEIVTVYNDERVQEFAIPVSKTVSNLNFDEDHFILKAIKD